MNDHEFAKAVRERFGVSNNGDAYDALLRMHDAAAAKTKVVGTLEKPVPVLEVK